MKRQLPQAINYEPKTIDQPVREDVPIPAKETLVDDIMVKQPHSQVSHYE